MAASKDMVSLVQLKYFIRVADLRSMSKAAEELFVAQSAVSTAIAQLERNLKVQLFIRRRSKGVALTEIGKSFYKSAIEIFATLDSAVDSLNSGTIQGTLTAGFFTTLAQFYLPSVMEEIGEEFPDVDIDFREFSADQMVEALDAREIEVALAYDFDYGQSVDFIPICEASLYAAVGKNHKFSDYKSIKMRELAEEPFILLDLGKSSSYFLSVFYRVGLRPEVKHRFGSFETVRSMVARGHGFTVLNQAPAHDLTNEGLELVRIPIEDAGFGLLMGLVCRRGESFSKKASLFYEVCVRVLRRTWGSKDVLFY